MLQNNKAGKAVREDRKRKGLEFAHRIVGEGLPKKVALKQRLEGSISLGGAPDPLSQPPPPPHSPCPKVRVLS